MKNYLLKYNGVTFTGTKQECYDRASVILMQGGSVSLSPSKELIQVGSVDV